jgi:pantothenate kinase
MISIVEMVEAHLVNVQRELVTLNERRLSVEKEVEKFQQYLQEGQATLLEYKEACNAQAQQPMLVGQADAPKVGASNLQSVFSGN